MLWLLLLSIGRGAVVVDTRYGGGGGVGRDKGVEDGKRGK